MIDLREGEVEFGGIAWRKMNPLRWVARDKSWNRIELTVMSHRHNGMHRDEIEALDWSQEAWQWEVQVAKCADGGIADIYGISSSFECARIAAMIACEFLLGKKPEHGAFGGATRVIPQPR